MAYKLSAEDSKLQKWFSNDNSSAQLRGIELMVGSVRGLKPFSIVMDYPITVISGKNGSGKTTLLALAACAFHNSDAGFKLVNRKLPYYTFSDFLIQSKGEVSPEGILIYYSVAYDKWVSADNPKEIEAGVFEQGLTKMPGGKWNSYVKRIKRSVVFFGIDRVVPHAEKSVSKSYRASFVNSLKNGCEELVQNSVSKVLGNKYEEFHFRSHSKYRLPFVSKGKLSYSGFNMGAGENALFEIFYNLHTCPVGTLAIIDEIELGLHQQAQKRLMRELKTISLERKIQIICTTHSPTIISQVPPLGRLYIENTSDSTIIIPEISADFAAGKLAGDNSQELTVFVEDGIAADLLMAAFDHDLRSRLSIVPIGSDSAIVTFLAGIRRSGKNENVIAFLDGDKAKELRKKYTLFLNKLESYSDEKIELQWIESRLKVLPGAVWPEAWMMNVVKESVSAELVKSIGASKNKIVEAVIDAELAGKHSEFYSLSESLHVSIEHLKKLISSHVADIRKSDFSPALNAIRESLAA